MLRRNDAGRWTKPSPAQYPHQWNWDSAFAALGWATFDWDRAALEVDSLLEARWRDGMLPHVRYDPEHLADYFPGPDWWPAAQSRVATPGVPTSGISNPPVLALAAERIGLRQPDSDRRLEFWSRVLDPLAAWLRWFLDSRRPAGARLPVVVHPWETGWDNSPRWDGLAVGLRPSRPFERMDVRHVAAAQRPSDRDYGTYLALAELLDRSGYDAAAYERIAPFAVHDVVVDALWFAGAQALGRMAERLERPAPFAERELAEYVAAFEELHWDDASQAYLDFDVKAGGPLRVLTAAGTAALCGGVCDAERGRRGWAEYRRRCRGLLAVPTAAPDTPYFEPHRYWRGPVWISVNWLAIQGLRQVGLEADAQALREETLDLVAREGFYEYYQPESGEGLGIAGFTWSAALVLDLLQTL